MTDQCPILKWNDTFFNSRPRMSLTLLFSPDAWKMPLLFECWLEGGRLPPPRLSRNMPTSGTDVVVVWCLVGCCWRRSTNVIGWKSERSSAKLAMLLIDWNELGTLVGSATGQTIFLKPVSKGRLTRAALQKNHCSLFEKKYCNSTFDISNILLK